MTLDLVTIHLGIKIFEWAKRGVWGVSFWAEACWLGIMGMLNCT